MAENDQEEMALNQLQGYAAGPDGKTLTVLVVVVDLRH